MFGYMLLGMSSIEGAAVVGLYFYVYHRRHHPALIDTLFIYRQLKQTRTFTLLAPTLSAHAAITTSNSSSSHQTKVDAAVTRSRRSSCGYKITSTAAEKEINSNNSQERGSPLRWRWSLVVKLGHTRLFAAVHGGGALSTTRLSRDYSSSRPKIVGVSGRTLERTGEVYSCHKRGVGGIGRRNQSKRENGQGPGNSRG